MDEDSYKRIRSDVTPVTCAFEKSILALRVCCSKASRINIAEREVVQCESLECQTQCREWLQVLRNKSQFSLQLTDSHIAENTLPHAKEMKVQVGGINGLASLLENPATQSDTQNGVLPDVYFILRACREELGDYADLPFGQIMKSVVGFHLRKK